MTSTELTTTESSGAQPPPTETISTEAPHTEQISSSETPTNPIETEPTIVKTSEDTKTEVWEGGAECPLPAVTNVTLTNLTD